MKVASCERKVQSVRERERERSCKGLVHSCFTCYSEMLRKSNAGARKWQIDGGASTCIDMPSVGERDVESVHTLQRSAPRSQAAAKNSPHHSFWTLPSV